MPGPLNLLCIASLAGALLLGVKLYFAETENTRLSRELAAATEVNEANSRRIEYLRGWVGEFDRATLTATQDLVENAALRARAAQTLQRNRDENADFRDWAERPAYPGLDRLLREALGQAGDNDAQSAPSPAAGLPANSASGNPD